MRCIQTFQVYGASNGRLIKCMEKGGGEVYSRDLR